MGHFVQCLSGPYCHFRLNSRPAQNPELPGGDRLGDSMVEGDFRMAHRKGMGCCRKTQTKVSLGLAEGWEGEHPLYPLPTA